MNKLEQKEKIDRQFDTIKKLARELSLATLVDDKDILPFLLKQDFFDVLLYKSNIDMFMSKFCAYIEKKMGVTAKESRLSSLVSRILGKI